MKRVLAWLLAVTLLIGMSGCKKTEQDNKPLVEQQPSGIAATMLVYMVGSDLEAKSAAGTNDMEEMLKSGVDLTRNNVLVCTGGSKKWYNDISTKEELSVLKLTADGFKKVTAFPNASMGESNSLLAFLNYGYQNFPAEKFSLVMWDHGDGPVIGYGKDMLYDNDSLTLREMKTALEASPFKNDNKLDWVGFDACLMSSAELACVWANYADYLVASQEIEPSFGWNYSFLSQMSKVDTKTMLSNITKSYFTACDEYYQRKGYEDRDTTLACVDLSHAAKLESAINALFAKAVNDVASNYNELSAKRVGTRALGRASTGSEYDLIDVNDMAVQLSQLYPNEAKQLQTVLGDMVIENATNTADCCGMSLYYPFYNKSYYKKSWAEVYADLGLFPEYQRYLNVYCEKWLDADLLDDVAASAMPNIKDKEHFELELSDAQAEAYADASYYILAREGEGLYNVLFSSHNVEKQGNTLTANFDGEILYAKNNYNEYCIPVSQERDTVGDITRYSIYCGLTNDPANIFYRPEGQEAKTQKCRFHLAVNNTTKKIGVSALVPDDHRFDVTSLNGGKTEEIDLAGWTSYFFLQARHQYLTRDENGVIKELSAWPASQTYTANDMVIAEGLEFLFAPLTAGEYCLVFQIEDTQGNRYCSELLPIKTEGTLESPVYPDEVSVNWKDGERVKLFEENNVAVFLTTAASESYETRGELEYVVQVENKNTFDVHISGDSVLYNDSVYCHDGSFGFFVIPAGQTVTDETAISFGAAADLKLIDQLDSLTLTFDVRNHATRAPLIRNQTVRVQLSEQTALIPLPDWLSEYDAYDKPAYNMFATEQEIYRSSSLSVRLLGFGGNDSANHLNGAFCVQNLSSASINFSFEGVALSGIFVPMNAGSSMMIPAKSKVYISARVSEEDLQRQMVDSVSSMSVTFRTMKYISLVGGGGFSTLYHCPISLAQRGPSANFVEGKQEVMDEHGVRICLIGYEPIYEDNAAWYFTVENNSGYDIALDMTDVSINDTHVANGEYAGQGVYDNRVGNHQKTVVRVAVLNDSNPVVESLTFRFAVMDFMQEGIIFNSSNTITVFSE